MRLSLILPTTEMEKPTPPTRCPYDDCQSTRLRLHQEVVKPLRDTRYQQVIAYRYQCMQCKRTFRVYPPGVNAAPTSQRVKELGVVLYMLGLSYRSVSHTLEALGVYLCASCVYSAVQSAIKERPQLTRQPVLEGVKTLTGNTQGTKVRYRGQWLPLVLTVDEPSDGHHELMLAIDDLNDDDAQALAQSIAPLAAVRLEAGKRIAAADGYAITPAELENQEEGQRDPVYSAIDTSIASAFVGK